MMNFKCFGHFYPLDNTSCRDILIISTVNRFAENISIDLLVVMMNPGSSKPLDENNKVTIFGKECVLTKPDNTQSQIMKIMMQNGYETSVVINLSDVRESISSKFLRRLKGCQWGSLGEAHSIFCEKRKEEFQAILRQCQCCPVVIASGVNYKLRPLTALAASKFKSSQIIGHKNKKGLFYHPLPRTKEKQQAWLDEINSMLKEH